MGLAASAARAEAPIWVAGPHSAVRLTPLGRAPDGSGYRVALEVELYDGFKTYWRNPGDSGVPPSFDWSRSDNLASVGLRWPAPKRFYDGAGYANGYDRQVSFPLTAVPRDPAKPLTLTLKLEYAVCRDLCIPAQASVSLNLPAETRASAAADLQSIDATVPSRIRMGETRDGLAILAVEAQKSGEKPTLNVRTAVPDGAAADLFAEGPDGWFFGKPTVSTGEDGTVSFQVPIEEIPKGIPGAKVPVLLTLVGPERAVEVSVDLDANDIAR